MNSNAIDMKVKNAVIADMSNGMSPAAAAAKHSVSVSSARRWAKAGIPQAAPALKLVDVDPAQPEEAVTTPAPAPAPSDGNVVHIDREVKYRNGKSVYRKRTLISSKKGDVIRMVKEMMDADLLKAGSDMEKVKESEKAVIEKAAVDLFNSNKALASSYVRDTVDEMRDGVAY